MDPNDSFIWEAKIVVNELQINCQTNFDANQEASFTKTNTQKVQTDLDSSGTQNSFDLYWIL